MAWNKHAPNLPLNSDPASVVFRSFSSFRFLGFAHRLGAGGVGQLPSLGLYTIGGGMSFHELLQWQWNGYPKYHQSRPNLLLHIVFVPIFLVGNVGGVIAVFLRSWVLGVVSLAVMAGSMVVQGRGHGQEVNPPEPFTGPANAISRIFLEQWITFPRFVISGGWSRSLNQQIAA